MYIMHVLHIIVMLLVQESLQQDFGELIAMHVGCFKDGGTSDKDLEYRTQGTFDSVQLCTEECSKKYYKYAGLQNGRICYCGTTYGRYGPGSCTMRCTGDTNQICGGLDSNTIYKTGINVSGPPENLRLKTTPSPTSLTLEWEAPRSSNGILLGYRLEVSINFSYNPERSRFINKVVKLSNSTSTATVLGLIPGSQYTVNVSAMSEAGVGPPTSGKFWTEVGTPRTPKTPTLIRHGDELRDGTIHVKLHPVGEFNGPITSYLVIVLNETVPMPFDNQTLYSYTKARSEGISYWITAELDPDYLLTHDEFVIGDNRVYKQYQNYGPLHDYDYHVTLAAVSQLNGVTKTSYAKVTHDQHEHANIIVFQFHDHDDDGDHEDHDHDHGDDAVDESAEAEQHHDLSLIESGPDEDPMTTVLTVSIVVASVLLLLAVAVFVYMRYSLGQRFRRRRRRKADTQELTAQIPSLDSAEDGYIDNSAFDGEGHQKSAEEYLQSLDGKVWQIPRNFVDVQSEVVGRGSFGTVMNGQLQMNQGPVQCNVYIVSNKLMDAEERRNMLRDLDQNIKAKQHENIVNLLGICEEQDTTLLVFDALELEMKQLLLDSRSLDTHPSYADKTERFSTIREEDVFNIMVQLAEGLDHLVNSGVHLKELCSRTVYVSHGCSPKIFGFGMAEYNRRPVSLDLTRWRAPEALVKNQFSCKSLVWSYGCVLWELVTLGGTPYPRLRTKEVKSRILQGMRLPQGAYVSDSLYQLMLTCWMTDPSERPDFPSIISTLTELMTSQQVLLSFSLYPGFNYESYQPDLEHLSSS